MRLVLPLTGALALASLFFGGRLAMRWTLANDSLEQSRHELDVLETELPEHAGANLDESAKAWSRDIDALLRRADSELGDGHAFVPARWKPEQRDALRAALAKHAALLEDALPALEAAPAVAQARAAREFSPDASASQISALAGMLVARAVVAAQDEHDTSTAARYLARALDVPACLERGRASDARQRLAVQDVVLQGLQVILGCADAQAHELRALLEPRLAWITPDDLLARCTRELAQVEIQYHERAETDNPLERLRATESLAKSYELLLVMRRAAPRGKGSLGSLLDAVEPRLSDWSAPDSATCADVTLAQSYETWSMLTALARVALALEEVHERRKAWPMNLSDALESERISADVPCSFALDESGLILRLDPPRGARWARGLAGHPLVSWRWN